MHKQTNKQKTKTDLWHVSSPACSHHFFPPSSFLATLTQLAHSPDLTLCDSLTQNETELSLETDLWS